MLPSNPEAASSAFQLALLGLCLLMTLLEKPPPWLTLWNPQFSAVQEWVPHLLPEHSCFPSSPAFKSHLSVSLSRIQLATESTKRNFQASRLGTTGWIADEMGWG